MFKRLLSFLLAAGMVLTASPFSTYAASPADVTAEEDLNEEVVGEGDTAAIESMDEFDSVYMNFLVRRVEDFSISIPMETREDSLKDYELTGIAVNTDDPYSWETGSNILSCWIAGDPDYTDPDDEAQSISFNMSVMPNDNSDEQDYIVNFKNPIPEGVNVYATAVITSGANSGYCGAEDYEVVFNTDRTAAKFHGVFSLGSYNQSFLKVRLDFKGLEIINNYTEKFNELNKAVNSRFFNGATGYEYAPNMGDYVFKQITPNYYPYTEEIEKTGNVVKYNMIFQFSVYYRTTFDEEQIIDEKVEEALEELDLDGKPDCVKAKLIHDYVIRNVTYDLDSPRAHDAYGAFVEHRAVCQGIAIMFYRLCREAGLDVRYIGGSADTTGNGDMGPHAWNIVRLGDYWYKVDVTFDQSYSGVSGSTGEWYYEDYFFLKGMNNSLYNNTYPHIEDASYLTEEFKISHPIAEEDYDFVGEPSFEKASLNLGGKIGLNLLMKLPGDESDYETSYMEFIVNGVTSEAFYDSNSRSRDSSLLKFTCLVNSLEMADEVKAVFHYFRDNEEYTVKKNYTIQEYIDKVLGSEESEEAKELCKALHDFGYYTQEFLSKANGWSLEGGDAAHVKMSEPYNEYDTWTEADAIMAQYGEINPLGYIGLDIEKVGLSLILDSDTAISLSFTISSDCYPCESLITEVNDEFIEAVHVKGRKYKIVIPNINASKLDEPFKIRLDTEFDSSDLSISAIQYAVLSLKDRTFEERTNAMVALYKYCMATKQYLSSL